MRDPKKMTVPKTFIDKYIKPSCKNDLRITAAFSSVPREYFMDEAMKSNAYSDNAQPIGFGQTISQPSLVAMMLYELECTEKHTVLEIGAGSGFVTALLGKLANEVYGIELLGELCKIAQERIRAVHIRNAKVICGDGSKGYPEKAPFDRIIVSAMASEMPKKLLAQMAEGGIMIIPIKGTLTKVMKNDGEITTKPLATVAFVDFVNS